MWRPTLPCFFIVQIIDLYNYMIGDLRFSIGCYFFVSQRMDLGECPKIHDLALRADYENAQKNKDHFYDLDVSKTL